MLFRALLSPSYRRPGRHLSPNRRNNAWTLPITILTLSTTVLLVFIGIFHTHHAQSIDALSSSPTKITPSVCSSGAARFAITAAVEFDDVIPELQTLLASMLYLTSKSLHVTILTDDKSARRIESLFNKLDRTRRTVEVDIVTVDRHAVFKWANSSRIFTTHHSRVWGLVKLGIPWLFPWLGKVVVLDTDMVFMKDPHLLWEHSWQDNTLPYKMPLGPKSRDSSNHICSCVVAINTQEARRRKVFPKLVDNVLRRRKEWLENGRYRLHLADQSIYYELIGEGVVGRMDEIWNRDRCHVFRGLFENNSRVDVGILHNNCYYKAKEATMRRSDSFFNFFKELRWNWMRGECKITISNSHWKGLISIP